MTRAALPPPLFLIRAAVIAGGLASLAHAGERAFPPSRLAVAGGELLDPGDLFGAGDCAECHKTQERDWRGSMHSRAHHDGLYRAFAELARKEAGEETYLFCTACHAPGAVAAGEQPAPPGGTAKHTFLTDEGVTCEVCHLASDVRTVHAGGGANASLLLTPGEARFGPLKEPSDEASHKNTFSPLHQRSEFCSACHTLIHPHNGLVIENTYEEWRKGPYAAAGIQCQDCHMRTVEQALQVAKTLKPVAVPGIAAEGMDPRPDVHAHRFVGANTNADDTGISPGHAAEALARLKGAATIALRLPEKAAPGKPLQVVVEVTNISAGHSIPTSITELRQVWIDLRVTTESDETLYRSGAVDEQGRVDPEAVMYHSILADKNGRVTYRPWEAEKMVLEKLIPPKGTMTESYAIPLPAGVKGPLRITATLRYRSAPQDVMDEMFGKGRFSIETVEMAEAAAVVPLR